MNISVHTIVNYQATPLTPCVLLIEFSNKEKLQRVLFLLFNIRNLDLKLSFQNMSYLFATQVNSNHFYSSEASKSMKFGVDNLQLHWFPFFCSDILPRANALSMWLRHQQFCRTRTAVSQRTESILKASSKQQMKGYPLLAMVSHVTCLWAPMNLDGDWL